MSESHRESPRLSKSQVEAYVRRFNDCRVAVLGDVMLDRYFWGEVDRISPEAPVPVVRVTRRSARLGGAANVAANIRALDARVDLLGVVGDDREASEMVELLRANDIGAGGLVAVEGRETTEKVRIIARSQQVVRADFESEDPPGDNVAGSLVSSMIRMAETHDALVVSDYGKGVITEPMLREVIAAWRAANRPVLVDPHVPHFRWYRGASVITPNTREATQSTGIGFDKGIPPSDKTFALVREMELDAFLVTRGEHGMSLYHGNNEEMHIPTVAREVYDVTGAGDTVIGVLAAALASGVPLTDGVILANTAAGEVVKEIGTTTLTAQELVDAFGA